MPRISAAALATPRVDGAPELLKPPSYLGTAERRCFAALVESCGPAHFRRSDLPLLARFCEADCLAQLAAKHLKKEGAVVEGRPSAWISVQEKAIRAMVALAGRLRLSPQSRIDPKTVGRQTERPAVPPWRR